MSFPLDLLICFISSLKPELYREVLAQQPSSFSQAAMLACLQKKRCNTFYARPSLSVCSGHLPPLVLTPPHLEILSRRQPRLCFLHLCLCHATVNSPSFPTPLQSMFGHTDTHMLKNLRLNPKSPKYLPIGGFNLPPAPFPPRFFFLKRKIDPGGCMSITVPWMLSQLRIGLPSQRSISS